jgi:hypothetical protein
VCQIDQQQYRLQVFAADMHFTYVKHLSAFYAAGGKPEQLASWNSEGVSSHLQQLKDKIFPLHFSLLIGAAWEPGHTSFKTWQGHIKQHAILTAVEGISNAVGEHRQLHAAARLHSQPGQRSELQRLGTAFMKSSTKVRTAVADLHAALKLPGSTELPPELLEDDLAALQPQQLLNERALLPWELCSAPSSTPSSPIVWYGQAAMVVAKAQCAAQERLILHREALDSMSYFRHHVLQSRAMIELPDPAFPWGAGLHGLGRQMEYVEGCILLLKGVERKYAKVMASAADLWVQQGLLSSEEITDVGPLLGGAPSVEGCGESGSEFDESEVDSEVEDVGDDGL